MKVLGVTVKQGEYHGKPYHNLMLHCSYHDENALGELTDVVKIKYSLVGEVFGKPMDAKDYNDLIGKQINVYYDKYSRVSEVNVLQQ